MFTHHQKCVLVDTQAPGNNRKITAFIGGLDLCDGRYDTPEHRLFCDLDTIFKDDFHQPTFPVSNLCFCWFIPCSTCCIVVQTLCNGCGEHKCHMDYVNS